MIFLISVINSTTALVSHGGALGVDFNGNHCSTLTCEWQGVLAFS